MLGAIAAFVAGTLAASAFARGHWITDENPQSTIRIITEFFYVKASDEPDKR